MLTIQVPPGEARRDGTHFGVGRQRWQAGERPAGPRTAAGREPTKAAPTGG